MSGSAARNPYDGGNKPCASSEPHEPHTWTLAAIDGNYYDCPGVPEPPAAKDRARANTQAADTHSAGASSEIGTEALPNLGASPGNAANRQEPLREAFVMMHQAVDVLLDQAVTDEFKTQRAVALRSEALRLASLKSPQAVTAATCHDLERMRAAEEVCYHILILMSFGCDADTILRGCDELQTWANLAARDGKLKEDDPEGKEVSHAVPYPHGPVLEDYPA